MRPHSGPYGEQVFANFTYLLRTRYAERAYYIRALFNDAVNCFEDGSIDLLHIDGLHTLDAVRNDFTTWLPKMSDRGVIIMHDTTVYQQDFGVWVFWRELVERYPTVQLLHSHGLGIVYVGTQECRLAEFMRGVAASHDKYVLLNIFFRGVGGLVVDAAEARQAAANMEPKAAELATARAEIAQLRASTSWKVSAPVRMLGRVLRRR